MVLNVYFTYKPNPNLEQEYNSTNNLIVDKYDGYYQDIIDNGDYYKFTYRLRNNTSVNKFIRCMRNMDSSLSNDTIKKIIEYNIYQSEGIENSIRNRYSINQLVDDINESGFIRIDDTLKLDVESDDIQDEKLNQLHEIFEDAKNTGIKEIDYKLEKLNQLVHLCASGLDDRMSCYQVFRLNALEETQDGKYQFKGFYEHMQESDYELMQPHQFGTIQVDYGMIGKDLQACFNTNDVELVKSKKLAQQDKIRTWISTVFDDEEDNRIKSEYYQWCESNNVKSYGYDYTHPKYNFGRVILGDLVDKDNHTIESIIEIKQKYPYLLDIKLEEE
jgi:hypothetical protein